MQALHTLNQRTPAKDLHRFWAWIESENVKEYKQDVALPTNETPKTKKAYDSIGESVPL